MPEIRPTWILKIHMLPNKPVVYSKTEVEDVFGIAVLYMLMRQEQLFKKRQM